MRQRLTAQGQQLTFQSFKMSIVDSRKIEPGTHSQIRACQQSCKCYSRLLQFTFSFAGAQCDMNLSLLLLWLVKQDWKRKNIVKSVLLSIASSRQGKWLKFLWQGAVLSWLYDKKKRMALLWEQSRQNPIGQEMSPDQQDWNKKKIIWNLSFRVLPQAGKERGLNSSERELSFIDVPFVKNFVK